MAAKCTVVLTREGGTCTPTALHCMTVSALCPAGVATLADVMVQTAPTNSAAAQSTVQNLLMNPTGAGQELPGRLLIAATLTAVAVGGYLLREKARKQ